jgi:hypothetical protein
VEVTNVWSYASTPQYIYIAWCLIKYRDNFSFLLLICFLEYCLFPALFFFFQFFSEDGAVASLLNLLVIYLDKDLQMLGSAETHNELNSDAGSSGSVEDVIIKVLH